MAKANEKNYQEIRRRIFLRRRKLLSSKESLEILQDLNRGMKEFVIEQKRKEKESEADLAKVILNA